MAKGDCLDAADMSLQTRSRSFGSPSDVLEKQSCVIRLSPADVTGEPEATERAGAEGCCSSELKRRGDKPWKDILTRFI